MLQQIHPKDFFLCFMFVYITTKACLVAQLLKNVCVEMIIDLNRNTRKWKSIIPENHLARALEGLVSPYITQKQTGKFPNKLANFTLELIEARA